MLSVRVSADSSEIILPSCYLLVVSSDSTTHLPLPEGWNSDLVELRSAIETIPVTSADAERAVSAR